MKKLSLTIIALCVGAAATANAQLPGSLKGKARQVLKDQLGSQVKQAGDTEASETTKSRPPAKKDKDRKYPPGLSFASVLNGVVVLAKDGKFNLNQIRATFVPDDCKEGFAVLRTADGRELHQFDWRPDRLKKPYSLLNIHKITDLSSGESKGGGFVDLSTPGDYVLDFYLPTEHFYTFPFTVKKISADDPFGEGECWVVKGDWEDWGYLYYLEARPDRSLQWKVWLCNEACGEKDIKVHIAITRDDDGDVVCTSRPNMTHSIRPQWTRYEFDMVFPEGKEVPHGTYFKAKDLLEKDGAYTLTMKIDEQSYGVWKFAVEDGALTYTGRTLRGEADPLTFIEGGRDAWWYAKEK